MPGRKYTEAELAIIKQGRAEGKTIREIVQILWARGYKDRTPYGVRDVVKMRRHEMPLINPGHVDWKGKEEEFKRLYPHTSNKELARHFGVSYNAITNFASRLGIQKDPYYIRRVRYRGVRWFEPGQTEIYDNYLRIYRDPIAIISDIHFDKHDPVILNRLLQVSAIYNIKTLLVGGDFLDMSYFSTFYDKDSSTLSEELKSAEQNIGKLLQQFREIYGCMGNHEKRLWRQLLNQMRSSLLHRWLVGNDPRLKLSEYEYAIVYAKGVIPWAVIHADKTRKVPLSLPNELAHKLLMNVIVCGDHYSAMGYDRGGNFVIMHCGHATLPERHLYKQIRITAHTEWTPSSFITIVGGQARLWSTDPRITDWAPVEKQYDEWYKKHKGKRSVSS